MATPKETELSGIIRIDADWKPTPPDSQALLRDLGIIDVKLLDSYEIKTPEEYILVGEIVVRAAGQVASINADYADEASRRHRLHTKLTGERALDLALPAKIVQIGDKARHAWTLKQDAIKAIEQARLDREQAERDRATKAEADRIQREADEAAAKLRRAGEMAKAQAVVEQAQQQVAQVVEEAEMNSIGVILPSEPKTAGLSDSRPWVGVVDSEEEVILAVAAGILAKRAGKPVAVPLMWTLPKRGGGTEDVPLLRVESRIPTEQAKRLGKPDIQIPGCHGERGIFTRHSPKKAEGGIGPGW